MASTPDPHPDSVPEGPPADVETVTLPAEPGRDSVEDVAERPDPGRGAAP